MKKVVSVSLGSSQRDHQVEAEFLGEKFLISRQGTDGDFKAALKLLSELDGKVDAIGLGGIDIYLYTPKKRYCLAEGLRLKNQVKKTPVVDGSGLKNTLEREVIRILDLDPRFTFKAKKVLLVCGLDRFGMAEALVNAGAKVLFGDIIFSLGIEKPLYTLAELEHYAEKLLPLISGLPISMLYPTGKKQEQKKKNRSGQFAAYYQKAEVVAGDFHFINKFIPPELKNQTIITNTVTARNIEELAARGVKYLVTTTPEFSGRSFGTNVLEGVMVAILAKPPEEITAGDYLELIKNLGLKPRIETLN